MKIKPCQFCDYKDIPMEDFEKRFGYVPSMVEKIIVWIIAIIISISVFRFVHYLCS